MKRQTRIITLLVIDSLFFFVEIIVGMPQYLRLNPLTMIRVHGAFISSGSRFLSHGISVRFWMRH